jgi:glucose-1-phosphate cytidylyltransferase
MQVVILCGGQGTRIRDVADDIPKPMIRIGGRPILWHIMRGFAHHGFSEFILCLGYKSGIIKRYFLDYHLNGVDFTVALGGGGETQVHGPGVQENWRVTMAETGQAAMTGARVKRIEKYISGDSFMLTYGDGVADVDITNLVRFHRQHGCVGTVTAVRPQGRFGEMELEGTKVTEFNEKPFTSRGWINGGFFVFNREIFDYLDDDEGLVFEQSPLVHLTRDRQLVAYMHHGFWQPMDTFRDYKYLNTLWDEGQANWNVWAPPALRSAA